MTSPTAAATHLEVLDLRHFSAPALRPLLEQEAARWEQQLSWDYRRSIALLLDYINSRSLTGYVAVRGGRVAGYTFGVCEAAKAVMGDLYAFAEGDPGSSPVSELLLTHLLETLQATPGIQRIESQLLLFPETALREVFVRYGFRAYPRLFMQLDLGPQATRRTPDLPAGYRIERWRAEAYQPAARLIQDSYIGHTDSDINDQYRTLPGAQRFLHNIVNFPGCGTFDAANSWLLYGPQSGTLEGMVLCSRVHEEVGHITQLCIRPHQRGHGLGAALLERCLAGLPAAGVRTVSLTVTQSNRGAIGLYQREGFAARHRFDAWVWDQSRR